MALTVLVALVCGFVGGLVGGVIAPLLIASAVVGGEAIAEKSFLQKVKKSMAFLQPLPIIRSAVSSEASSRRAGCGSPARPDLWGAPAGNRPGLPDSALTHCCDLRAPAEVH